MNPADDPHALPPSLQRDVERNQNSRGAWEFFASHRAVVTAQLARVATADRTGALCLLGAGNLNDVTLAPLLEKFRSIDAIDWDETALRDGALRQRIADDARLRLHGGVDLSGIAGDWERTPVEVDEVIAHATNSEIRLPRDDYRAIASLCLLSQLVDHAVRALGEAHPRLLEVIQAIRRRHLRLMLENLTPGGLMMLVTDFVSSDTCPELLTLRDQDLPAAANRWILGHNFFTGLNPHVLLAEVRGTSPLAPLVSQSQLIRPWRWQFSANRAYAVCAILAVRA